LSILVKIKISTRVKIFRQVPGQRNTPPVFSWTR